MHGRVLDFDRRPVGGAELHVYHADSAGSYSRSPNAPPRLAGDLRTAPDGRYEVHTVVPGSYGFAAHVHVSVRPPGGEQQHFTVNIPRPFPPRRAARPADLARVNWLAPLEAFVRDSSGVLRLRHDFVVGRKDS